MILVTTFTFVIAFTIDNGVESISAASYVVNSLGLKPITDVTVSTTGTCNSGYEKASLGNWPGSKKICEDRVSQYGNEAPPTRLLF